MYILRHRWRHRLARHLGRWAGQCQDLELEEEQEELYTTILEMENKERCRSRLPLHHHKLPKKQK
jgi:hypothetical protein